MNAKDVTQVQRGWITVLDSFARECHVIAVMHRIEKRETTLDFSGHAKALDAIVQCAGGIAVGKPCASAEEISSVIDAITAEQGGHLERAEAEAWVCSVLAECVADIVPDVRGEVSPAMAADITRRIEFAMGQALVNAWNHAKPQNLRGEHDEA